MMHHINTSKYVLYHDAADDTQAWYLFRTCTSSTKSDVTLTGTCTSGLE